METGVRFGRVGERSLSIRHSRNQRGRSSVVQTSFPRCSPWGTGELERGPIGALLQHGCWRNSCPVGVQRHAIEAGVQSELARSPVSTQEDQTRCKLKISGLRRLQLEVRNSRCVRGTARDARKEGQGPDDEVVTGVPARRDPRFSAPVVV